jgi:hypothetical protein
MAVQIQIRRGTAAAWTAADPTLAAGEFAIETDTDKYKIGDGSTAWTSLGYSSLPSGSATLASPTFTGVPAAPTASANTNTTQVATTAFVMTEVGDYAPLASPALTGNPVAPTQSSGNNSTRIATTAYADAAGGTPTDITVADTTDTSCSVALFESATGDLAPKSDAGLTYNAGTGTLNAVTSLGGFTGPSILTIPSNTAASMTLDASQAGAFVRINIVANNTVTVPPNSAVAFPIGTQIIFMVLNSGVTTFVAGSGVTIYSQNGTNSGNNGDLKIDGLYCSAALVKTLTDQWHLFGKLTS